VKLQDVTLADLCRQLVMARRNDPNDFMGLCVRLKNHQGRCQKICNGMTAAEAEAITAQDCEVVDAPH
jgi:hypothetical protein